MSIFYEIIFAKLIIRYLSDIEDFAAMNEVYNEFFSKPFPARMAFAVKDIPKGALVEISAIAVKNKA